MVTNKVPYQNDNPHHTIYPKILLSYLSVQRYNSVNFFQLRIQWFSNATAYATWHVSNSRLLPWCALIALVSSALMLGDPIAMKMHIAESTAFVRCSFQPFDHDSATLLHRGLELDLRPGDCQFIIELIICYILHRYLILSSLSQVLRIIISVCVIVTCIYTMTT